MDWLTLDNTAKIYPLMNSGDNQNMFRANVELYEEVSPTLLLQALNNIVPRFPMLTMRLKRGFFWYYLEKNDMPISVYPEPPIVMEKITPHSLDGYNIRVMYYKKRISVDFYHILCDGGAAVEFFKCLIAQYLILQGKTLILDGSILNIDDLPTPQEYEDSFVKNYKKMPIKDLKIKDLKGAPAYRIEGKQFPVGKSVVTLTLDSVATLNTAKGLNCSVTEFLSALLILSAHATRSQDAKLADNFCLFLPINIRRFYHSHSMRNFSMFTRANVDIAKETLTFEECVQIVSGALKHGTDKEVLDNRINTTVRPSTFLPMRIMPLSFKSWIFGVGNRIFGKAKKSCSISNLGVLKIPPLEPFVDKFHYQLNTNALVPLNIACCTFKNKLTVSILRNTFSNNIVASFAKFLIQHGLDVSVESNDWEVNYEL